jgi:hypothetical protein
MVAAELENLGREGEICNGAYIQAFASDGKQIARCRDVGLLDEAFFGLV